MVGFFLVVVSSFGVEIVKVRRKRGFGAREGIVTVLITGFKMRRKC